MAIGENPSFLGDGFFFLEQISAPVPSHAKGDHLPGTDAADWKRPLGGRPGLPPLRIHPLNHSSHT